MFKITLQVFFNFLSKYYAKEFIIVVGVMHQASQDIVGMYISAVLYGFFNSRTK